MSDQNELVVVRKSDLDALITAAGNVLHTAEKGDGESIVQAEFMQALERSSTAIKSRPVAESLRHVEASGEDAEDPVLAVLPPDMDSAAAEVAFAAAVQRASAMSADGESLPFFECLQESLAEHGIVAIQEVDNLASGPWDIAGDIPPEPSAVSDDDPEWVKVTVEGPAFQDSDTEWEMTLEDGSSVEFVEGELSFIGFVRSLTYQFPRGDRYGVPEAATDSGGREFIVDELGFACSRSLDVYGIDTGDDSASTFVADCIMPRDILRPVEVPEDRPQA